MTKKNKHFLSRFQVNLFVVLVTLVGLILNVYLITNFIVFKTYAADETATFYFVPSSVSIPPDTSLVLMLDPKSSSVSFVNVNLYFDPAYVSLDSVTTFTSSLGNVVDVSSLDIANSEGKLEITLTQDPDSPPTFGPFQVATLNLTPNPDSDPAETEITIVDEDTQIVGTDLTDVPFVTEYVSVNRTAPPAGDGLVDKSTTSLYQGDCPDENVDTALGCFPYSDSYAVAAFFLHWGIGIAGGIAFMLIVYAGFIVTTSSGDPKRLTAGKQLLTAAVSGLLFLIFGAYLLRFIGIDALKIPGL